MQPAGNEKQPKFPGQPASPFSAASPTLPHSKSPPVAGFETSNAPRATSPFLISGPVAGLRSSGVPQNAPSSLPPVGPSTGFQPSSYIPPPISAAVSSSGPPPPPPTYFRNDSVNYQQPQGPTFPPANQPLTALRAPPVGQPLAAPTPGSFRPPPQVSSVPMGPPPTNTTQLSSASRPPPQVPMPGFTNVLIGSDTLPFPAQPRFHSSTPVPQTPAPAFPAAPLHVPSFHAHQGLIPPPPPPNAANTLGFNSREKLPYPNAGPPLAGALHSLVEEFQSLSVGAAPGSLDPGVDPRLLPKPLSGDEEPTKVLESYPLNCHPRFLRLTTHAIPNSQSLLARWHLPLGAVVHPLAEMPDGEEIPIINFGSAGIIRCRRCRTYVNPYVTFTDAGRKWQCNLCALLNDVPGEYYCALDANGTRCDVMQRPELCKGSVEFVAPSEYMVRPPMPPLYFFLIDVSVSAVRSGFLEIVANTIKSSLNDLPGFPRTQIGFITFDSTLHFHNLKSSLSLPQMLVVADIEDVFLPLPDNLLVNLADARHVVESFLDTLPTMFQHTSNVESAFGPALRAAFMVMSQFGGKLLAFQSTLPSLGVGRLKLRGDDLRVYGTDKEHSLRIPEDPFYKQMAAEFTKNQIAVDIYAFGDKYSDIASLGTLAKYTGGQVYHYPFFQADIHQDKLKHDLARDLTRKVAWEAVLRIRCGKGLRFTTYHGHFMLRSTDLLALPAVDCDKAFAMQLSLEETLMATSTVYFQVALLYTSSSSERRIRVLTSAAPVVADLTEIYRQADTGAIVTLLSRLAVENSLSNKLEDARQSLQLRLVKALKEYRNLHAVHHRLMGRLIYPESLKFLMLYILALCKSVALRGGYADASLDERCAAGYNIMILPISRMLKLLYPSLYRVDEVLLKGSQELGESLKQLAPSVQSLDPKGIYILDDGFNFVIWLGRMLSTELVNNIAGVDIAASLDLSQVVLCEPDNEISKKLMKIFEQLRKKNRSCYQLPRLVRQGEQPREFQLFLSNLVEDQTSGTSGYVEWIVQIFRLSQG